MNRTIIYGRVSTEDQLEKFGLPSQLRACREFAAGNGLSVITEITDDGVSGTILDRPGLARVRQMVAAGEADVVLMLDADRLSRELAHLLILKPEIEKKARLEFVTARFEDSPSGRMFFGIRGVIAQYERELTRERTMRGKVERARSGKIVGGRIAYGYRYEDGRLLLDEERAPIASEIFHCYLKGVSIRSIALRLRSMGAPTWSGRTWGHSSVRRILTNETYAGTAYYGTLRRDGKKTKRRLDLTTRVPIPVPALVTREQWDRVQSRLAENPQNGRPTPAYLLRGLLYCAACGKRMSGNARRSHLSYRCNGRDPLRVSGDPCRVAVNARRLDAAVWAALVETLTDGGVLRSLVEQHEAEVREAANPERLDQLGKQARKLRAREERCLSLMADPDLESDRAAMKVKYLEAQRERRWIEGELAAAEAAFARSANATTWIDETSSLIEKYLPTITDPEARQTFVRGIVTRAVWDGASEVMLDVFIGPEMSTPSGRCETFGRLQITVKARLAA